jgi:large subunit ribosomal protein L10e
MRGAFGKPYALVARVSIGQILISIRCKEAHANVAIQALRRSMYKFPGRQRVIVSKKWGFTKVRVGVRCVFVVNRVVFSTRKLNT